MRWSFLILIAAVTFTGCASFEEAYVLDREFGKAQMETWDKMIAYPDSKYADKQPEGMEGIHAEPAMGVYHRSYSKEPTATNVIQLGIVDD
jgi:hypothetical protein